MPTSKQVAPVRALVLLAQAASAAGCTVIESRPYGRVHRVHRPGSWHYDVRTFRGAPYSLAIDINHPASGAQEFAALARLAEVASGLGVSYIHASHGTVGVAQSHQTHAHADVGEWSNLGEGPFRTRPRLITAAGIQDDLSATIDNAWGAETDRHIEAVRAASRLGGQQFPFGVEFAQQAVGARPDGDWGRRSRAAHDRAVKRLEHTLREGHYYDGRIVGVWSDEHDRAIAAARKDATRAQRKERA